ncbi:MAG: type II toxin-antitoxin system RelE family toxin [Methanobacteriota archaeon]
MAFRVKLHPKALKALRDLPAADANRVKVALRRLADDPRTARPGADIKRLKGTHGRQDLYRIRIGGYRAVYAVEPAEVLVTDLFARGAGYDV